MSDRRVTLEIAVTSRRGAAIAAAAAADRVELCSALELGGVSPAVGLVEAAVAAGPPVHVLIRCRPGDFRYDRDEVETMERDVAAALGAGAAGVVVGALDDRRHVDVVSVRRLVDAARAARPDCELTFHRAVDVAADPVAATAQIAGLGFDRILTSGAAERAPDGIAMLRRLVAAAGRLGVMAGGGVTPDTIPELVNAGVAAVHLSARRPARETNYAIGFGRDDRRAVHYETDEHTVAAARNALRAAAVQAAPALSTDQPRAHNDATHTRSHP